MSEQVSPADRVFEMMQGNAGKLKGKGAPMLPRAQLCTLLLLLLAGCGGGTTATAPAVPAAVRLAAVSVGMDTMGNDVVTVTATVTDEAGRPVSGRVEVHVDRTLPSPLTPLQTFPSTSSVVSTIAGTSDENRQLSVPVAVDPSVSTTITAVAGSVKSNTISVSPLSGYPSAPALVAVIRSPDGRYDVNCSGFDGVAGAEVDVTYDLAAASGAVIEWGPFWPNDLVVSHIDEKGGSLRMADIMPYPSSVSGAGTLATFFFGQETATSQGTILSLQVKLLDVTGGPIPARTMLINSY